MFKRLLELLNFKKSTKAAIIDNTVLADEVCFHRIRDRVKTHRGYHTDLKNPKTWQKLFKEVVDSDGMAI